MWDLIVSVPDHCLYFYFVLLVDKMADQNLPGYQPRIVFSASKMRCLYFVTVAVMLLQLIYCNAYCNIAL